MRADELASAHHRRVSGLLPLRVPRAADRRPGRRRRAWTTSRRWRPRSTAPAPTTSWRGSPPASTPSSAAPGRSGAEPSFGQWQKLSLARGFMRDAPLVQVLDEPTAALDAETEHALFERYAAGGARADGDDDGRITIFVSHRFSTVRMADLIVVLDGARLAEVGIARGVDGPPRPLLGALRHPGGGVPPRAGAGLS